MREFLPQSAIKTFSIEEDKLIEFQIDAMIYTNEFVSVELKNDWNDDD